MKLTTLDDLLIGVGLVLLVYGLYCAWPPLGFIAGGAILTLVGLLMARPTPRRPAA